MRDEGRGLKELERVDPGAGAGGEGWACLRTQVKAGEGHEKMSWSQCEHSFRHLCYPHLASGEPELGS